MTSTDRRRFLLRSATAIGTASVAGTAVLPSADPAAAAGNDLAADGLLDRIPFDGKHQAGILDPAQGHGAFLALDVVGPDADALTGALQDLTRRAREMCTGTPSPALAREAPPLDSGTLGATFAPDGLTVTVSVGASLFDDRFGLAKLRPKHLTAMPRFGVDASIDPDRTGGDLLVQICAGQQDTVTHALREIMRAVRGTLELRWVMHGFQSSARGPSKKSSPRNLFAFRDGTANPDVTDGGLMDQLVWAGADEPSWAAGGTYEVVRTIRMQVEFWDRVGLREQENMIGRFRESGAPLGGTDEFEDPRLDLDPQGQRIPLDAHIRLANPRTAKTDDQKILRRGFNYDRGFDDAGALDQGLVFVAFNQDPSRQFAAIQARLDNEPMADYIRPVGGGYFFTLPGTGGADGWLGQSLLAQ